LFDLAVHGRAWAGGLAERWVYVEGGRIARVAREPVGRAAATIELGADQFLMPAATDLHVHLRDWSQAEKETVETGTKSALAGGVTTVAEMPNTDPRLAAAELVERRMELLGDRSFVDFAVHAAAPDDLSEVGAMGRAGAFGLKLYPPDLPRFPALLRAAGGAGLKVAVHAEEQTMLGTPRSARAEAAAVREVLERVDGRSWVRFAHLSTPEAAKAVLAAKRSGRRGLTIEVAPHHLFMDRPKAERRIGVASRVNPQLRSPASSREMRRLLLDGSFDFYATDHAPHTLDEKLNGGAPGFPALELALPLFLTRTEDLALACRMFCEAPAAYLGVEKGLISAGFSADLVVVSRRDWRIDPDAFVSKARVTPFAGERMSYAVDLVLLRGSAVYQDGRFVRRPVRAVRAGRSCHVH